MNAHEEYQAGNLLKAVTAALEEVKQHPTDGGKRYFLSELLCFSGDLERADRQLDTLAQQDSRSLMNINLFRQLIRAEQARQQFFTEGRLPEFLNDEIPKHLAPYLEASILIREGKAIEAGAILARAEERRPLVSGTCDDGQSFDRLRDLDDLTSAVFEVLTSTGKYFWIPIARVESIEFRPPTRPRDLLWIGVHMTVRNGPDGEVFLPVLYPGAAQETDDHLRLGRKTEWRESEGGPVRGCGQRILLVGEEDRPVLEIRNIAIDQPGSE